MKKVKTTSGLNYFEQAYEIIKRIPRGKVLTYGIVSRIMNKRISAAAVGWALNALASNKENSYYTMKTVPWHRVVNAKGALSTKLYSSITEQLGKPMRLQQILLEEEGIVFNDDGTIDFDRYLWRAKADTINQILKTFYSLEEDRL